jgi:hypothetical protein
MRLPIFLALGAPLLINALSINTSDRCGAQFNGLTCKGSTFGECCSKYNYCGTTSGHCGSGCQTGYGVCTTSSPPVAATASKVSTDGSCAGSKGLTCQGSAFGNCCSQHGYCGKSSAYCGEKCNAKFGTCSNVPVASSSKAFGTTSTQSASSSRPASSQKVSTEGRCGNAYGASGGMTCTGSKFGQCCSQYSYWYVIARLDAFVRSPMQWFHRRVLWQGMPKCFRPVFTFVRIDYVGSPVILVDPSFFVFFEHIYL